jgi:ubiquinone/menaquinone biosynthesis C-methylase UbiE
MTNPARMYHDYFVPAIFSPWSKLLIERARPQPGERVLDIACGTGIVARQLAPLVGKDGQVLALDLSAPMLEVARDEPVPEGAGIEWVEGSAQTLPDRRFDLVVCQQGLQFFPDPQAAVQQMRRVLDPGGRAVVAVWQDLELQPVYKALSEAEARHLGVPLMDVAMPFTFDRRHSLEQLFTDAGFARVDAGTAAHEVAFPHPAEFIARTIMGASAVIPELAAMDDAERRALVEAVTDELRPSLAPYIQGDTIRFPMHSHIVVAHA